MENYGAYDHASWRSYWKRISSVVISDGVTSIGDYAFYYSSTSAYYVYRFSSITIADSVTNIGNHAFGNCKNLKTVTMSSNVTSIGEYAFSGCGITSIDLPDTLTEIGSYAFHSCTSLTSIIIPNGITIINEDTFESCTSLTYVKICEGVETIDIAAFCGCSSLVTVIFPKSLTKISFFAFASTTIEDVYYAGTEEEWSHVTSYSSINSATYHFEWVDEDEEEEDEITLPASGTCGDNLTWYIDTEGVLTISGTGDMYDYYLNTNIPWYEYASVITEIVIEEGVTSIGELAFCACENVIRVTIATSVIEIDNQAFYRCTAITDVYYDATLDEWNQIVIGVNNDSILDARLHYVDYTISANIDFSTGIDDIVASISTTWDDTWFATEATTYQHDMATTAMALAGATYVTDSSGDPSDESIIDALTAFNFNSITSYNYDYDLTEDDNDVVAYTFAYKTMYLDGEYTEVVMIAIKGTSSNEEWYSNFEVGVTGDHAGFSLASKDLLKNLSEYLKEYSISENAKFFVTGHSRGAAVANLVAKDLTDTYGSNDVYAYTFACPSTSVNATSTGYENIVNICSGEDFITTLPLEDWGFGRYGITLNLPSRSYFSSDYYSQYLSQMSTTFKRLTGSEFSTYSNGTKKIDDVIAYAYSLASSRNDYYYKYYTTGVLSVDKPMYMFFRDVAAFLIEGTSALLSTINSSISDYYTISQFFVLNLGSVTNNHCMAAYYSWMSTLSSEQLFGSLNTDSKVSYKRMTIACPVDVYVYNESDELVAAVVNEEITVNTLAVTLEDEVKTIDLPCDQEYRIVVVAYDEGTVDYTVALMDTASSMPSHIAEISNIEVVSGDELSGNVVVEQSTTNSDYDLLRNQTETLQATVSKYVFTSSSATHTHTTKTVKENYVAPTATEEGSYDMVTFCTDCGEILSQIHMTIPALGDDSDSVIVEDVVVDEPVEDTNTQTEEDTQDSPELEVTEPEVNPTTGIAISLLPLAIVALAAASSKRR